MPIFSSVNALYRFISDPKIIHTQNVLIDLCCGETVPDLQGSSAKNSVNMYLLLYRLFVNLPLAKS